MEKTIIYLDIEDEDMYSGMDAISFVDQPATEINWTAFSKQATEKKLFKTNKAEQIVTSPVMLAETEIFRTSEDMGDYYVKFSAEMISRMRNKYVMDGRQNEVNENHDSKSKVKDVYMVESYIVGDKVTSELYPDLPKGTWVASFHIPDTNYWNKNIMSDKFKGFSLEGFFIESYEMSLQDRKVNDVYNQIEEVINSNKHDIVKTLTIKKILNIN